jgi:hypothetical protein
MQWKEQVPKGLHLRPEATDPVWLERQRLSLYLCKVLQFLTDDRA